MRGSLYVCFYVAYGWPNHWTDCAQIVRTYSPRVRDQCLAKKKIHKKLN